MNLLFHVPPARHCVMAALIGVLAALTFMGLVIAFA